MSGTQLFVLSSTKYNFKFSSFYLPVLNLNLVRLNCYISKSVQVYKWVLFNNWLPPPP
eukprot:SAG31_NODE_7386_length_1703_cov_1.809227_1_plen_57_part_10